jgi:hypothetical protein
VKYFIGKCIPPKLSPLSNLSIQSTLLEAESLQNNGVLLCLINLFAQSTTLIACTTIKAWKSKFLDAKRRDAVSLCNGYYWPRMQTLSTARPTFASPASFQPGGLPHHLGFGDRLRSKNRGWRIATQLYLARRQPQSQLRIHKIFLLKVPQFADNAKIVQGKDHKGRVASKLYL